MRTYGDYGELQLWAAAPDATTIGRREHLAVVRFELIERGAAAAGWIDLTFAHGGRTCVVPGVLVDLPLALRGDPAAFAWPRAAAAVLEMGAADALAARMLIQFAAWTSARVVPSEAVAMLADCSPFASARAASDLGAAPLATVLPRVAPWVYAARIAGTGPAALDAADGALGAAVLRRFGVASAGTFDERAAAWYGVAATTAANGTAPTLIVSDHAAENEPGVTSIAFDDPGADRVDWRAVGVMPPQPMDVGIAFDTGGGPHVRRFWVRAPCSAVGGTPVRTPPARRPAVPLTFVVRDDFGAALDADAEELAALTAIAHDAGVPTRIIARARAGEIPATTVPIAVGDVRDVAFCAALEDLARRGGPFIAWLEPIGDYPDWHEQALVGAVRAPLDDAQLGAVLRAYDARALVLADVPATEPPEAQTLRTRLAAALSVASAIVLPATQSRYVVSQAYGGRGRPLLSIPPIVGLEHANDAAAVFGSAPYAFARGTAEARSLLLLTVLALRDAPIPAFVAADVVDPAYAALLRSFAGPRTTVLTNPAPDVVTALYRNAALYVDAALRPRSLSRLVRAARAGALPVVFADSPLAPLLDPDTVVPRRGVADLRDALTMLWHSPLRRHQARAATLSLDELDRADVAAAELFGAICDLTGG